MTASHLVTGFAVLAGVMHLGLNAILPALPPMVVNDLRWQAGKIIQDRTIRAEGGAFYAGWAAGVVNADTGLSVRWCEGSGAFAYEPGRKVIEFALQEWTGRAECTAESLPPGRYFPRAVWSWGIHQTAKDGPIFEISG